ncbi:MAG: rod shape-determining protein MreD [Lachnospiraceae bacterium]|nr:rod shape-determining protein MreD [Lachnospiraceae bacterium]
MKVVDFFKKLALAGYKKILTVLLAIALFLFETQWQEIFRGFSVTPNFLLMLVVFVGFLAGKNCGMILGFFTGLLLDVSMGIAPGVHAAMFVCLAWVCGFMKEYIYEGHVLSVFLTVGVGDFLYNFLFYIFYFLLNGKLNLLYYMKTVILPETVLTMALTLICYPLFYTLHRKLKREKKELISDTMIGSDAS